MGAVLRLAIVGFLISLCGVAAVSHAQDMPLTVPTSISLESERITLHEPTVLNVSFDNRSEQEVVISFSYSDEKLNVTVIDPDGLTFERPPIRRSGWGSATAIGVKGGSQAVQSISLGSWFQFEKLGTYRIVVKLQTESSPKESFKYRLDVADTTLSLTVLPRTEPVLVSRCMALLTKMEDPSSPTIALSSARALSTVNDPAAVPFLANGLRQKVFVGLMIESLARLRTPAAVDVLELASHSSDPETASLAKSALTVP